MHSSDEHLSSASQKQRQQSLPARSFATYQAAEESKSSVQMKESSSEEEDEDNSTVDKFDTNYEHFKPQHLSLDHDAPNLLSPSSAYRQQQTPGSTKKGRSLSIASVLSPLSPSSSPNYNRNVPQFLTVSPTFTPRARPPPAYVGNFTGGSRPSIAPPPSLSPRMNTPSPSRPVNPSLAVSGQMPSFEAAKGGILGSATSQLLNSRSRHQSIDVKISTGSNQVLSSHLARKRQSVVSAKILETLQSVNANYSGVNRRLMRGQTCYGSGSGPSNKYFSPSRFVEGLKESYDEEQDYAKAHPDEEQIPEKKKISIVEPILAEQRASILTTATTRTYMSGEEKENQIDEELLSSKMEDAPIEGEHVKISFDASDKLSQIKETQSREYRMSGEDEEPEAPTFSLGERIVWAKAIGPEYGTIKWIGRIPKMSSKWTVGIEFDNAIGTGDGNLDGKRYFTCKENYAKFLPLRSVSKLEAFLARPREGTLLSRMSIQLKPGQLISVQRTPSANHIPVHCALNAPHHIDHDVHETNMQHCLCNSCNHPCAHLCKTKNAKGSKKKERAHMCHFSQKPHNKLCCGGEALRELIASGKLEKVGGLLQEVKDNAIAVAASEAERVQALKQKSSQRSSSGSRISSQIGAHAVGSVGSAAIGGGFNTVVVRQRKSGQSNGPFSLTPPPPSPPIVVSPLPRSGLNPSHDSSTLGRESRRKTDRSSVGSRRIPSSSAPSSVERVSVCSLSSCSKKEKSNLIETSLHSSIKHQEAEEDHKLNGALQRSGSELSISSLPSTTSPVEVYIARGALTDESDYESDLDNNEKKMQKTANNLEKSSQLLNSHADSHLSSKHSGINSHYGSNIYQPHHRSAIRSMFACLVGRQPQHPATFSTSSKENYTHQNASRASSYYYDAGLDSCVRLRKKTKKSKQKTNKKKKTCRGQNNYCYYCTSHNYPSSTSQAPSRTSNQSTTTSLQTGGSRHSTGHNSQHQSNILNHHENASILSSGRNLPNQIVGEAKTTSHHLNVKNSCGLSPSPEPDSQQALLSNYSDRSSCHSGHSNHHSINSSNYKDYITNFCSKTSSYNHDCHPECSRKNSANIEQSSQMDFIKPEITSLSSVGKVPSTRSHTSPMLISPPHTTNQLNVSNAILVTAKTHLQETDLDKLSCSSMKQKNELGLSELGEIVNTKDDSQALIEQQQIIVPQQSTSAQQPPTTMDFVEQLHQFQQQYLKQHPEVKSIRTEQHQVATECNNDPNNNQQLQQQQTERTDLNSTHFISGSILQTSKLKKPTSKSDAQATNISTKKTVTKHSNKDTKITQQKHKANSSNASINSSSKVPESIRNESEKKPHKSDERLTGTSKPSSRAQSRPGSKASDRKEDQKVKSNQSTQSIAHAKEEGVDNKGEQDTHDSTSNSILSLNSNSLGAGQSSIASSDQIVVTTSSDQLSQTSVSSSNKTLPHRTNKSENVESTATSTTSITSQTVSSSNTSGIVTSSPVLRRRKKPPAPRPPNSTVNNKKSQPRASTNISQSSIPSHLHINASTKVPTPQLPTQTNCNLALSHSNSSFMTTGTDTYSSLMSMNLINATVSDLSTNSSSVDLNSLKRKKKSSKSKPAPQIPIAAIKKQINHEQQLEIKLTNEKGNNMHNVRSTSSCSKQLNSRLMNGSSRLTPHKTPCMSVNHRNKSNVKRRINAILNRSLSEAFRLNAKTALNSVQHSFSSEVSLNRRNLNTMINNTAFTDSFANNEHRLKTPSDSKKKKTKDAQDPNKKTDEQSPKKTKPDLLNSKQDAKPVKQQIEAIEDQSNEIHLLEDRSFTNSNRLVNQLFTTQPNTFQPIRRCSSLPYLAFSTSRLLDGRGGRRMKNKANQKRTSTHNVANDLIIETLSNNLYNGSADQILYAAELLEEFSENVVAVPPLSCTLAALLSPQHYQKHNLNNQLLLINHYINCLKHEQEQEELLTVQLIEQQQVNRMMIEINKEQECTNQVEPPVKFADEIRKDDLLKSDEKEIKLEPIKPTEKLTVIARKTSPVAVHLKPNGLPFENGHESSTGSGHGSDELHSDTSDGKVTVKSVKCMPTSSNLMSAKQVTASSSGLSNSSSKTLLADQELSKSTSVTSKHHLKRSLDHLQQHSSSTAHQLNKNIKQHRHHYCSNKNVHCLMHSQSSHCLNEHHPVCRHLMTIADESSSSSSQSTRSTDELNQWSSSRNHQFRHCASIGLKHHQSHSLHLHSTYLNSSSSECSTDDSGSVDSPMLMHLHHKNCLHHHHSNNLNNTIPNDDLICACCEHRTQHRVKSGFAGVTPTSYVYDFERPLKQIQQRYSGNSANQNISNLYDYHSTHLEDMFNSENSVLINQELNELMSQLENAIACGEHKKAAILARELARCTLALQRSTQTNISAQQIVVYLYIEDLNNHVQGPIPMQLYTTMTVRALKLKVQKELGFDVTMQKWILGKSLASNEDAALSTYGVTQSGCPLFLYLFNSEELCSYQHHHHFLTESLPSLVEINEEQSEENDEHASNSTKKLNKKLSASLDTNLSQQDKNLNKRLDKSLDTNLNKNKTLDRRSSKKHLKKPTTLIDEMLDCKFNDDELSDELLPPPINFQSFHDNSRIDLLREPLVEPLVDIDTSIEPISWINSKLHESLIFNSRKAEDEQEEYESASEELIDHSIEEDRSIEEIIIEEEVYECEDEKASTSKIDSTSQNYKDLIKLDDLDLVTNKEQFECSVCMTEVMPEEGVLLKECLHSFCKNCLTNCVELCEQPPVYCPYNDDKYHCDSEISLREMRALFAENEDKFEQYLKKSVKLASLRPSRDNMVFLCKTADCEGFCYYEANTKWFLCPLCETMFCLRCQDSHNKEQQCKLSDAFQHEVIKELTEEEKKSEKVIQEMIDKGQAMHCPRCTVIVFKHWGCSWVKCSMCKIEICWITKKARWGPAGKGDTSDGCRCMVNGIKCHPKCDYCH